MVSSIASFRCRMPSFLFAMMQSYSIGTASFCQINIVICDQYDAIGKNTGDGSLCSGTNANRDGGNLIRPRTRPPSPARGRLTGWPLLIEMSRITRGSLRCICEDAGRGCAAPNLMLKVSLLRPDHANARAADIMRFTHSSSKTV